MLPGGSVLGQEGARPLCPGRTPPHLTGPQEKVADVSFSREEQSQLGRPTFLRMNSSGAMTSICFLSYIKRSFLLILRHRIHVQFQDSGNFAQPRAEVKTPLSLFQLQRQWRGHPDSPNSAPQKGPPLCSGPGQSGIIISFTLQVLVDQCSALFVQESAEAAPQQAEREDVMDG